MKLVYMTLQRLIIIVIISGEHFVQIYISITKRLVVYLLVISQVLFLITTSKKENTKEEPPMILRIIWAISLGVIAVVLLAGGGISALQTSVIVTGVPFAILVSFAAKSLLKNLNQ